jgi:hypothetical protein
MPRMSTENPKLTANIGREQKRQLKWLAIARGVSVSALLRDMIAKAYKRARGRK